VPVFAVPAVNRLGRRVRQRVEQTEGFEQFSRLVGSRRLMADGESRATTFIGRDRGEGEVGEQRLAPRLGLLGAM
jgi:hypothetical protein